MAATWPWKEGKSEGRRRAWERVTGNTGRQGQRARVREEVGEGGGIPGRQARPVLRLGGRRLRSGANTCKRSPPLS
jgi:hypothetical protein